MEEIVLRGTLTASTAYMKVQSPMLRLDRQLSYRPFCDQSLRDTSHAVVPSCQVPLSR